MVVAIGFDTHKASVAGAAVDELGRVQQVRQLDNNPSAHREVERWVRGFGDDVVVGIECSATYGAALARHLIAAGILVKEVPPGLAHREANRPRRGKSDPTDAIAIARVVARECDLGAPKGPGASEDLKLLSDFRDQLVHARTQLANRIHKDLVVIRPGYNATIPNLVAKKNIARALQMLRGQGSTRAQLTRRRISELRRLDEQLVDVRQEIAEKLRESGTSLTELRGVGVTIAAKILGEVGDVRRIRSKAAFGMLTGTAPLPASSGTTTRHRLNRGGNRKLNVALHHMALTLARTDPETKAFIARHREAGKSHKEAIRCLKRHLANVVFRTLMADATPAQIAA